MDQTKDQAVCNTLTQFRTFPEAAAVASDLLWFWSQAEEHGCNGRVGAQLSANLGALLRCLCLHGQVTYPHEPVFSSERADKCNISLVRAWKNSVKSWDVRETPADGGSSERFDSFSARAEGWKHGWCLHSVAHHWFLCKHSLAVG